MSNVSRLIELAKRENARNYLLSEAPNLNRHYRQMCCYSFDLIGTNINIDGRFDKFVLDFITALLKTNIAPGAVLDVGANIGNHTVAFAETGRQVFSFEPHPKTFRLLEINTEDIPGVHRYNLGASNIAERVQAVSPAHNLGASSISDRAPSGTETSWSFDVIRLDDMPDLASEHIAFMKVDVEGHEQQALEGARDLIARNSPVILLEQNADDIVDGSTPSLELLRSWGYAHFYSIDAERPWRTPAKLPFLVKRLARVGESILFGPVAPAAVVKSIHQLDHRDYAMILASTKPIDFTV